MWESWIFLGRENRIYSDAGLGVGELEEGEIICWGRNGEREKRGRQLELGLGMWG